MNRNLRMSATAVVALVLGSAWCFGATVEEVEKQIKSAHEKLESCTAKVTSNTEMKQGGQEVSMNMTGTYSLMQKDGKTMYRMESKTTMKMTGMPDIPGGGEQNVLIVCDGDTVYTQTSRMGMTQAMKTKPEENMIERPWGKLAETHDLKVLADEKVDGQDCFVVEAKSKTPAGPMQPERIVFYCRKDIGMLTKQLAYAQDGTVMNTLTFDDMKVNPKLGADEFKYTAPEGVSVVDQTGA